MARPAAGVTYGELRHRLCAEYECTCETTRGRSFGPTDVFRHGARVLTIPWREDETVVLPDTIQSICRRLGITPAAFDLPS